MIRFWSKIKKTQNICKTCLAVEAETNINQKTDNPREKQKKQKEQKEQEEQEEQESLIEEKEQEEQQQIMEEQEESFRKAGYPPRRNERTARNTRYPYRT
jgi:hypothetical protein